MTSASREGQRSREQAEPANFLYRTRNSLWWVVVFLVIAVGTLAMMKGSYIVPEFDFGRC